MTTITLAGLGAFPGWKLYDLLHPEMNLRQQYNKKKFDIKSEIKLFSDANNIRQLQKRYRKKYGTIGEFTYSQWLDLIKYYCPDNKCLKCGQVKRLVPDHVISAKLGGTNNITNIQPLCECCNSKKNKKCFDYRPDLGRFTIPLSNYINLPEIETTEIDR